MTTPFQPAVPLGNSPRWLYRTTANVLRQRQTLGSDGGLAITWATVGIQVDPYVATPGQLLCRIDFIFTRPGKDQPAAVVAGRAPDRVAVCFFDPMLDTNGLPTVRPGDRLQCIAGPVQGTFEIRVIPEAAQDYVGVHHIEVQVVEVSQALASPSQTTFPGSAAQ
jgi:hypothetical protein